jgi:urease accessory protein
VLNQKPSVSSRPSSRRESPATAAVFAANRARGKIELAVKAAAGLTRRARVREEGALRVRCPGQPSQQLEAILLNTAGGVAGGDRFRVEVSVQPGARLVVTTAAAEKIYRSLDAAATIDVNMKVGAASLLAWLPQETILFDRARLARTIEIELADNAQLVLAEAVVFGRARMGESVHSGQFYDRWHIRRNSRTVHAEAMRIDGNIAAKLAQPAVAAGAVALATVLVVPADETQAAAVRALARAFRGEAAASAWKGMLVARLCATDAAALRSDLTAILGAVGGAPLPRLWSN